MEREREKKTNSKHLLGICERIICCPEVCGKLDSETSRRQYEEDIERSHSEILKTWGPLTPLFCKFSLKIELQDFLIPFYSFLS